MTTAVPANIFIFWYHIAHRCGSAERGEGLVSGSCDSDQGHRLRSCSPGCGQQVLNCRTHAESVGFHYVMKVAECVDIITVSRTHIPPVRCEGTTRDAFTDVTYQGTSPFIDRPKPRCRHACVFCSVCFRYESPTTVTNVGVALQPRCTRYVYVPNRNLPTVLPSKRYY